MDEKQYNDGNYLRNVIGISGVEFLWGLGLPVVVESTFLQLFLTSLGASSFAIGMIPAFFFIGSSFFALLSSYHTAHLPTKRRAVIWFHFVSSGALFAFGVILFLFGRISGILVIFFVSYAVLSICVGMTMPVWLNYLVKIFSEARSVSALAFMMIAQNVAKLTTSFFLIEFVERHTFSIRSSALIFIAVGILFFIGSLFFYLTREWRQQDLPPRRETTFGSYVGRSIARILKNRNFLYFLVGDLEYIFVVTAISFYANYATQYCGIPAAIAAGMFVACIYIGSLVSNIVLGPLGLFGLKNKYILSKVLALVAMGLLISGANTLYFYMASLLLGASRGTRMLVYAPAVKKLSGMADSTSYFAVAPLLALPISAGLPLVCGRLLDHFAHLGGDAYRILFAGCMGLLLITLVCILKTDFDPKYDMD